MNPRGQTTLKLGGRDITLRLTLGALADIESAFDISIQQLPGMLQVQADDDGNIVKLPRIGDLIVLIEALASGGDTPITKAELRGMDFGHEMIVAAVAAIVGSFPDNDESGDGSADESGGAETQKKIA